MPPKTPLAEFPCTQCGRVRMQWTKRQIPAEVCHWCETETRKAAAAEGLPGRFFAYTREGLPPVHRPELGPCLIWTGSVVRQTGYGRFNMGRDLGVKGAHVVAFFLAEGRWPVPFACHHCDNRVCVRRSHLFEGTASDNNRDMASKGRSTKGQIRRTHCPKGHPYAGDNLVLLNGSRRCRACVNASKRAAYARKHDGP